MRDQVAMCVGLAGTHATTLSLDDEHCYPWSLFLATGWLCTAADWRR